MLEFNDATKRDCTSFIKTYPLEQFLEIAARKAGRIIELGCKAGIRPYPSAAWGISRGFQHLGKMNPLKMDHMATVLAECQYETPK